MCRLVAYLGKEIVLEEIVIKPANSIIKQSLHASESKVPTNGDGFGLGWYAKDISPNPALFTSIAPAWNDRNLLSLASKIKSNCFFAHVRSASLGGVTTYNCHPFVHKQWMFMHNGDIPNFVVMKRHLRHLLDDDIYHWIQGETDSEHSFALFLQLAKGKDLSKMSVVVAVFLETIETIRCLAHQFGTPDSLYFNVCMTDGYRLLASRYCANPLRKPESMHYYQGSYFSVQKDKKEDIDPNDMTILVSSEKLTKNGVEWQDIPANHFLLVDRDKKIQCIPIDN